MAQAKNRSSGVAARKAALEILLRVDREGAYADVLLGNRLPDFAPNDRGLVTLIVLGTIAWRDRLDFEIERLAARPLAKIDLAVLEILRLGLFQLRHLDRVPMHAAVDTAVTLANSDRRTRDAAGFVNAVLRKATRQGPPIFEIPNDDVGTLALKFSHPRWMAERLIATFGRADAETIMAADNEAAPTAIRLNLARASREEILSRIAHDGLGVAAEGRFPETLILKGSPHLDSASFREGLFHVQSEASQIIAHLLAPAPGATVVDCAAAPGGKATHLAELVGARGCVIALDMNFAGLRVAREIAHRLGHDNVLFARADIADAIPLRPASFDYVLLDAPCTGTGTLREHPEIRRRLAPSDPARMATLQLSMLRKAAALLRPGGAMVYSVCSLMHEEGAGVTRQFVAENPQYRIDSRPSAREELGDFIRDDGTMLMRPDRGGLDGFFAARVIRT
ncbi:MAG TPA: 16S rRNA (cytosine(967)-C(5))-methyltransferase RsmB [Candidatus Binataceae bacterium]|nr:16S rRNA (cytosine(967)-C(5))-methyltransferase RsmB [Candidatus Binataceae bacterium]